MPSRGPELPRPRRATAVVTTVYPGAERWFASYARSLEAQRSPFDWVVLRDGAAELPPSWIPCTSISFSGISPAEIRHRGLCELRRAGYHTVVMTDIDDSFVAGKVGALASAIEAGAAFAYGDLDLCNAGGDAYERGVLAAAALDRGAPELASLLDRNFLGLSHTALSLEWLDRVADPPSGCHAYDWWLFTSLLALGATGRFVPGAETRYVQGEALFQPSEEGPPEVRDALSRSRLALGHRVKLFHYGWLREAARLWTVSPSYRDEVARALAGMEELGARMGDPAFVERYLERVNAGWRSLPRGWWGTVVSPREAGLDEKERSNAS